MTEQIIFAAESGDYFLRIADDGEEYLRYRVVDSARADNVHTDLGDAYRDAIRCMENVIEWAREAAATPAADVEGEIERRRLAGVAESLAADLRGPLTELRLAGLAASAQEAALAVRAAAVDAVRSGDLTKVQAAEAAGTTRPTLDRWLRA